MEEESICKGKSSQENQSSENVAANSELLSSPNSSATPHVTSTVSGDSNTAEPDGPKPCINGDHDTVERQMHQPQGQDENMQDPSMSKNQMKKLRKHQRYLEKKLTRKDRRKEMRQRKKLELEEKRKQLELEGGEDPGFPPRKQIKLMSSEDALPLRVAIDLSFDNLMNERDMTKLVKQLQRSYAINRRADRPLQLYLTSFGGESEAKLAATGQGYKNWDVNLKSQDLVDIFSKDEVIYLTSDSPNVLSTLDMSKVLVIGGLVDHNHHKGLCYRLAIEQGFGHAQLPIGEYIKLNSRKVLTVNQVYEIIVQYTETSDWKEAFYNVIPPRKIGAEKHLQSSKSDKIGDQSELPGDSSGNEQARGTVSVSESTSVSLTQGVID